jgi:(1->4)-alpha-D-glucan 1-alpha-D-glucosylmutase
VVGPLDVRAAAVTRTDEELPDLASARVPRATYRVQLHGNFRFADTTALVPYLRDLGISHLYASPYLRARPASMHGYDIVDHNALNPEIGDEHDHDALCAALRESGIGQLLDIVPNHMGVLEADNAWWLDVMEHGPASPHAQTFDIDWTPTTADMDGQLLVPVLGCQYGEALEAGDIELRFDAERGELRVDYYDHRFPLDPRHYARVLAVAEPKGVRAAEARALRRRFAALPRRDDATPADRARRQRESPVLKQVLAELYAADAGVRAWVDACVGAHRGTPGEPSSFDRLDDLLQRQAWRLAHWRVAGDEINYRRFFDVNTLAGIRVEREDVFEATHRTILRWLSEGRLDGLRIDHPDGLADPTRYFERLQARYALMQRDAPGDEPPRALYVVIEKILAEHEHWPSSWRVHGDTGYRFANLVNGIFVDARNAEAFDRLYDEFAGRPMRYDALLVDAKRDVMARALAADLHALAERAYRIAQSDRRTRDFTRNGLRAAIAELAAAFPVYRTYIDDTGVHDLDRQHLEWAAAAARRRGDVPEPTALDFVVGVMLGAPDEADPGRRDAATAFVRRFQQFTPPVMAKAMEDTAFYRYHRLVSLNDVGGEPRQFGTSVAAFHAANQSRQRFMPHSLVGTSTHDSKRSEDVRARIDVLSEMPAAWREAVARWREMNRWRAERIEGDAEIDPNDEMLLYQTLVGAWPLEQMTPEALGTFRDRIHAYMQKAVREAKELSSWLDPNAEYEAALARFIDTLLGVLEPNPFLTDLRAFVTAIAPFGCWNGLVQSGFKLTVPGVPDIYQGCERWAFRLVDPDNRRPVDFEALRTKLASLAEAWEEHGGIPEELLGTLRDECLHDGRLKMLVTWRLLQARARWPELFAAGRYVPVATEGPAEAHAVAYARECNGERVLVVGSRLLHTLARGDPFAPFGEDGAAACWGETRLVLPDGAAERWTDLVTGRRVDLSDPRVSRALCELPVAALVPSAQLAVDR